MSKFSEKLEQATNEDKQVNKYYVEEITKTLPRVGGARLNSESDVYPNIKTDGVYKCYYINKEDGTERNFLLQLECKLDIDFNNSADRAKVLLQVCCYLKQIHDNVSGFNGDWKTSDIPVVVVLGSKINCMTLATKWLLPYAQSHIVGYKSASTAYTKTENRQLLINIENESNIQAYSIVYDVMDKDCIKNICDSILKIGQGIDITDDLTENNISKAFDFFDMYVLDKKQANKLTSRQKVDLFIGTFYSEDFREDKSDRWTINNDIIRLHGIEIKVDPIKYNNFKLIFNMRQYSRLEQKRITAITDRLIDDTDRRRKGDFYTPSIWVDEAHKLLSKNLGDNWKEEYMVWDCAWGTGNLTRDYRFKDLYCSTLHNEDLNIGARYNKDACKFQYDFLNDDVEEFEEIEDMIKSVLNMRKTNGDLANNTFESAMNKLRATKLYKCAPGLIDGLMGWNGKEKKRLLFFINPPYKGAGSGHGKENTKNVVDTKLSYFMKCDNFSGTGQLYMQFLYRIIKMMLLFNRQMSVGIFTPSQVLNAMTFGTVRFELLRLAGYSDGFILQASNFADVSSEWGISFTVWGGNNRKEITELTVKDIGDSGIIDLQKDKMIIPINKDKKALIWIKDKEKGETEIIPRFTNAINYVVDKTYNRVKGSLATLITDMGIVESNMQRVAIMPSRSNANWTIIDITINNFDRVVSFFTARRLIQSNWINCKDEYMIPTVYHPSYNVWQSDCIIYSLFNTASNQSSIRNIKFGNKIVDIQNEFFWMSVKDIEDLAGGIYNKDDINTKIEDDIEKYGNERFVYKKLQEVTLSQDAQAVLDKAIQLVNDSFKYRKEFNEKHPEYHINTWDAGWYQIKGMLKEYMPNELKEFNSMYKALEDRMRPLVYELGFLYK